MTERQQPGQHYEGLQWHTIHGAPYFIREEREGVFNIVRRTSNTFQNGVWCMASELDSNFSELVLDEDICEFYPEHNVLGFLANCDSRYDFSVIRGLRHLARLERALYVSFQPVGETRSIGTHVDSLDADLILARFFNRTYDEQIDPHAV